jgi:hypothetical protein
MELATELLEFILSIRGGFVDYRRAQLEALMRHADWDRLASDQQRAVEDAVWAAEDADYDDPDELAATADELTAAENMLAEAGFTLPEVDD